MTNQSPLTSYRVNKGLTLEEFADLIGVNKSTVLRWEDGQVPMPVERVFEVERVTGISRHKLRPDIFNKPAPQQTEAAP